MKEGKEEKQTKQFDGRDKSSDVGGREIEGNGGMRNETFLLDKKRFCVDLAETGRES